nr:MAG: hypothetical protein DIU70_12030 [Bacillota bacterium]
MDKQVLLATGDTALDRRLEQELGCTAIPVYYREALRQLPAGFRPDVAVVSTRLPGREPLVDCVMALRLAGVRVVLIGPRPEAEELEQLVALGVHDLLVGDQPLSRIAAACHQPATLAEALAVLEQAGAAPKPGRWRQLMQGLRARMAAALPTAVRRLEVAAPPRVDRPVARNPVAVDGETTNDGTAGSDGDNSSDRAPDAEPVPATLPVRHVAGQQHEVGQQEEEAPAARLPPAGVVDKPGVHVEEEAARARGSGGRAAAAWPLQLPPGGRHVVAVVEADRAGGGRLLARRAQGPATGGGPPTGAPVSF